MNSAVFHEQHEASYFNLLKKKKSRVIGVVSLF